LESSCRALKLAERHDNVYAAVGVHPYDASSLTKETLSQLSQLATHPKVVAIGEIGLDYHRDLSPRAQQIAAFEAQLRLATELDLPVIVHQRESAEDVLSALQSWAVSGHPGCVLHAFSGDLAMANEAVLLKFFIGVGGPVTFKNARQLPEIIVELPLSSVLLETDAPYLAPHPYRGKRNEPAYVALVAERVAQLRDKSLAELSRQVTDNALRLFRLPPAI
jgi:TatD DNase family protein